jgi:hypothetical protein
MAAPRYRTGQLDLDRERIITRPALLTGAFRTSCSVLARTMLAKADSKVGERHLPAPAGHRASGRVRRRGDRLRLL